MKKYYFYLMAALIMATTCITTTSCSDDDNDTENVSNGSIVGTWKHTASWGYVIYAFKNDGSGYYQEYDEGRLHNPDPFSWTYNTSTKVIRMIFEDEDDYVEKMTVISVDSKKLVVISDKGSEQTFTKQ